MYDIKLSDIIQIFESEIKCINKCLKENHQTELKKTNNFKLDNIGDFTVLSCSLKEFKIANLNIEELILYVYKKYPVKIIIDLKNNSINNVYESIKNQFKQHILNQSNTNKPRLLQFDYFYEFEINESNNNTIIEIYDNRNYYNLPKYISKGN